MMKSEFEQLAEKVTQLAAMTQSLRGENAALRRELSLLQSHYLELKKRMNEANQRLDIVLAELPAPVEDKEEIA